MNFYWLRFGKNDGVVIANVGEFFFCINGKDMKYFTEFNKTSHTHFWLWKSVKNGDNQPKRNIDMAFFAVCKMYKYFWRNFIFRCMDEICVKFWRKSYRKWLYDIKFPSIFGTEVVAIKKKWITQLCNLNLICAVV